MKAFEPFLQKNKNRISSSKLEYKDSNSLSINKNEFEKGIEKYIIENLNKSNKKISTSSLLSDKKIYSKKNSINEDIFRDTKKNLALNSTRYPMNRKKLNKNNSCPLLILNNLSKTQGKFYSKITTKEINNENTLNMNYNQKTYRKENDFIKNNKLIKKQYFQNIPFHSKREIKTFYKPNNINFLLDKRIKIIKKPQRSEQKFKNRNNSVPKINKYELEFNYKYKKMFDRRLPLNDLRNYKTILFEESKIQQNGFNDLTKNQENVFSNKKLIKIKKSENKNNTNNNNSIEKDTKNLESNFETIELHGIITKVMTKLPLPERDNIDNINEDFHKIMKHPLLKEQFGYNFLRNLDRDYKIFENPLKDNDLIQKIKHLIINPNTRIFRNGNLMYNSAGFYRKRNDNTPKKDYKLLSKKGYIRLKNSKMNKLNQDIEENVQNIEDIKDKINLLMEKNKQKFKEHKEELDNENK